MKTNHPMRHVPFVIFLFTLLFFAPQKAEAQFIVNGSAMQTLDTCWTLTTAQNNLVGSIWNEVKIDLNQSFQVLMQLNFGSKDANGADGIVFGFQPVSTSVGQVGEGIGFQGVVPSLGIEFDTWQNFNLGDPEVFWGFTSATGGANNLHQVCLAYTTFLDGFEDVVICPGGQLQLDVGGGIAYKWTPEIKI